MPSRLFEPRPWSDLRSHGAIRNRVEESGLVQLDLSALLRERTCVIWTSPQLWQGLAIREQEFGGWLKDLDVTPFEGADVAIHCSAEAILPEWCGCW